MEARRLGDGHAQAQRRIGIDGELAGRDLGLLVVDLGVVPPPARQIQLGLDVELLAARAELAVRWGGVHVIVLPRGRSVKQLISFLG